MKSMILSLMLLIVLVGCKKSVQEVEAIAYTIHKDRAQDVGYRQQGLKLLSELLNAEIKNLKAKKDMEKGELTIDFDYPSQKWLQGTLVNTPKKFLVRLFDKNGNNLTYFTTSETFVSEKRFNTLIEFYGKSYSEDALKLQFKNVFPLKATGNSLTYSISLKDLEFLHSIEFGVDDTKFAFNDMIE